jgi:hypothetical protein
MAARIFIVLSHKFRNYVAKYIYVTQCFGFEQDRYVKTSKRTSSVLLIQGVAYI